ncbi:MAG: hypothetical protein PVF45_07920, partial [Anaerolineae bacterium]
TSVTALCLDTVSRSSHEWAKDAEALFVAALTVLLARGLLGVGRTTMTRSTFGRQPREHVRGGAAGWRSRKKDLERPNGGEYLIVPGPHVYEATVDGALEQRIIKVVRGWGRQPAARELPFAPTVFDLVRAIVPRDYHPGDRLVRLAQNDAAARELGTLHGGKFATKRKFIPDSAYVGRMRDENQAVRALQEALWQSQPDFCRYMRAAIKSGIASQTLDID